MKTFSSTAGYGQGGLGRVFAEIIEKSRCAGELLRYFTPSPKPDDDAAIGQRVRSRLAPFLSEYTPIRFSGAARQYYDFDLFDRAVAKRITSGADHHVGFCGQSLRTFRSAVKAGYKRFELIAPTSHVDNVEERHRVAFARYPLDDGWLNEAHRVKALREYEMADEIRVGSQYSWDSFVRYGVPAHKLRRDYFSAHPRFKPPDELPPDDGIFRVVYTGAINVTKGVPLLLDAFASANLGNAHLTLVGSTGSRGMRKFMESRLAADPRVSMNPGDPMPHLHRADLYVHPSYQDGYPYSVLEALACDVPVLQTEDSGTRELIREGENGWVIPTDDKDALIAGMERAKRLQLRRQMPAGART
jgi:glycosyltransferase involved in cell wall biosynthesis